MPVDVDAVSSAASSDSEDDHSDSTEDKISGYISQQLIQFNASGND